MTLTLLPSAPVVLVAWMKNHSDLAAIHGGRVGTQLNSTLPAIRLQRIGGSSDDFWEDNPLVQVECWAQTEAQADNLARSVVAALPTVRGTYSTGRVYTYNVESGPYWSPDDPTISSNSRYILTVRLLTTA